MEWHEKLESAEGVAPVAVDARAAACVVLDRNLLPDVCLLRHLDTREQVYRAIDLGEVAAADAPAAALAGVYADAYHWLEELETLAVSSGAPAEWAAAYEPMWVDFRAHMDGTLEYLARALADDEAYAAALDKAAKTLDAEEAAGRSTRAAIKALLALAQEAAA